MVEALFAMEILKAPISVARKLVWAIGLGQFRTVKIPSEPERIKQKKIIILRFLLFSIPLRPLNFGPNYEFE